MLNIYNREMMKMHSRLILVFTIPPLLMIPTHIMAQSGFTEYDNKYFTMAYPTGWTVNDTKFGDLMNCCYHDIIFTSPNQDAKIFLEVYGFVVPPRDLVTLDKDYWQNKFSYGNAASVLGDGAIMPAVTNSTACEHGYFAGYKDWCINHSSDCVDNILKDSFPDMIVQAREQNQLDSSYKTTAIVS